jgi:prevent-host-death family protein
MIIETSVVDFSNDLGMMLKRVQHRRDSIVISEGGKPSMALIDIRLFEKIQRVAAASFGQLCASIEAGFAQTPEAEGMVEIDAACKAERSCCEADWAVLL